MGRWWGLEQSARLIGIAVTNSILLVDYAVMVQEQGMGGTLRILTKHVSLPPQGKIPGHIGSVGKILSYKTRNLFRQYREQ
ncbi:hypothetical protein [Luteimonas terricola]|uniref:hypothetical protein n=1 Tax=Luteimonas terricola TaxID=645597 RepID=UPI00166DF173|nr:hypothetical protein [Luteimonas terricola]